MTTAVASCLSRGVGVDQASTTRRGPVLRFQSCWTGPEESAVDPTDGAVHVGVPFSVDLFSDSGGSLLAHMSLTISASGVEIAGVTIGSDGEN